MNRREKRSRSRNWTRREFLKTAGATAGAVGATLGFPPILKYALGETPIKIGIPASLSGTASLLGEDFRDASMLAAEHVNAKGGLLGRKVEVIVRDTAGSAAGASTRAKEMIESDKVDFMAGANLGHEGLAVHEQTYPKKMLYVCNTMSDPIPAVPTFSKYTFHLDLAPFMMGNVVGRYTAEKLGKRWYFLIGDYAWPWQNYEGFSRVLQEYKGENLGVSPHPMGTKDFSPYIGKILAAKPDVLIQVAPGFDQVNAWKQLREFGAFEKMKIVTGLFMPGTIWAVGVDVVMGGYGGATFYWEAPETKEMSDIFWKRFGRPPTDDALSQYESVMEICSAVQRTKSMDVEKLIRAMEGHHFKWAKTEEFWRACDHQAIQDIYILEPKKPSGKYGVYDCFNIIERIGGEKLARTCEEQGHKKDAKGNWIRYQ
jgi:branched-chain amino acid transport system substrate-binding protein